MKKSYIVVICLCIFLSFFYYYKEERGSDESVFLGNCIKEGLGRDYKISYNTTNYLDISDSYVESFAGYEERGYFIALIKPSVGFDKEVLVALSKKIESNRAVVEERNGIKNPVDSRNFKYSDFTTLEQVGSYYICVISNDSYKIYDKIRVNLLYKLEKLDREKLDR